MTDRCEPPSEQDFIAPWDGLSHPPTRTTIPSPHFRIKAGVLQQLHSNPKGSLRWWINVRHVSETEQDVIP